MKKRIIGFLLAASFAVTPVLAVNTQNTVESKLAEQKISVLEEASDSKVMAASGYICTGDVYYDSNGDAAYKGTYKYNADGQLVRLTYKTTEGDLILETVYQYDEYGNVSHLESYDDYEVTERAYFKYDSAGNLLEFRYYIDDEVTWEKYEYNADNLLVKYTNCDKDGNPINWTEYVFDENGNQTQIISTYEDGSVSRAEFTYEGLIVWEASYVDDELTGYCKHEYNDSGLEIQLSYYDEQKQPTGDGCRFTYDSNGNETRVDFFHADGTEFCQGEYTYDEDGNVVKYVDFQDNYYMTWEFDENGNMIKETSYDENGEVGYSNVYTYKPVSALTASDIFVDINEGSWYTEYVNYCYNSGLMAGMGELFQPNTNMTRAMVVQILYSIEGKPEITAESSPYTDVQSNAWYYDAVCWATQNNIVSGIGNEKFGPNAKVTREQFALMLYGYAGRPEASGTLSAYPDEAKVSEWAVDALIWAIDSGIISGNSKDGVICLDARGLTTRAQASVMLFRYTCRED